ncbi:MAG: phage late control D family protein [Pseudobutyrivibrio sp.]|uniref:phage late control D family protein n=1 Tax=Pseudobutyrivibrio sp. TaxID=2014367 RepID=UPI0025E69103|nr:hypothetical protein [Pseudobutyrivibrio sp.]MBQ8490357.1 phage late control D family protein [Pseudobutyrivibrio sp.]
MDYENLKTSKYSNFDLPVIQVKVNDKAITDGKRSFAISNVTVDLTAGFEASQASFGIYNAYDYEDTQFEFDVIKNYVLIGSYVQILMGYNLTVTEVFRGVITRVNFVIEDGEAPYILVTAMDVKAVMMANRYHKAIKAKSYSEAVKEIFKQGVYESLKNDGVILSYEIGDTPDKNPSSGEQGKEETDKMIEMVGESDYEFVTRVAKKFNYEFFVLGGRVYFRAAKLDKENQITISPSANIKSINVEYDITGLTESVEVRGLDVGKAKLLKTTKKNSNKLSQGNKAKSLITGSKFVYIDPTVASAEDAGFRAGYLLEDMMYRYGSLELEMIGLPDILPGKFIKIDGIGKAISNEFYVQTVRHTMSKDGEYITKVIGKAAKQSEST